VIYIAPEYPKRIRVHWEGARRRDRLTESSGSLNDVFMKPVFGIPECAKVRSSTFLVQRYEVSTWETYGHWPV